MFDTTLMMLAASFADVTTIIYWALGTLGGCFVGMSFLSLGDTDADVGGDVDADFDVDVDGDFDVDVDGDFDAAGGEGQLEVGEHGHGGGDLIDLATWFSVRFLIYFSFVFGAVGLLLKHFSDLGPLASFAIALVCGTAGGQSAHQFFRYIRKTSGNSAASVGDYLKQVGRVTIAIAHDRKGEVAIHIRSGERYLPALAKRDESEFSVGDEVVVVQYQGGIAKVVSREEFEFLNKKS